MQRTPSLKPSSKDQECFCEICTCNKMASSVRTLALAAVCARLAEFYADMGAPGTAGLRSAAESR